jgi:hypothetical protein
MISLNVQIPARACLHGSLALAIAGCSSAQPAVLTTASVGDGGTAGVRDGGTAGAQVTVDVQGSYSVTFRQPPWTFAGTLGTRATNLAIASGTDGIGPYGEVTFAFHDSSDKTASIRAYDAAPIVLFTVNYVDGANNAPSFPIFTTVPQLPYHVTYSDLEFAPESFTDLTADSPFVFFDDAADTFILSAATHFMNASTTLSSSGALSSGIDPSIALLPAGFTYRAILVADQGINTAYETWGHALTGLSGKKRPANDATPNLERFGYWTDNGAYYYYQYDTAKGYPGTLLAVRDSFSALGIPLAYMQLDSWWYPKGPQQDWAAKQNGLYTYTADTALFASGLTSFQQSLGLPLVTHARWIDQSSPYRSEYAISNNVSIDPSYWAKIGDYIKGGGVTTYEQDWLNVAALPKTDNLHDQDAFLDDMASAMASRGITMQYCMPLPRHFLQSTKYDNLLTTRVSTDRFGSSRYRDFFYVSLLAKSLGEWPWADVFYSSEPDNVLLATLSAGIVGVGDQIGTTDSTTLFRSIRPDGVIVKPDWPIVPTDQTFLNDAKGVDTPLVAATFTDFGGMRASYVYAFSATSNGPASFSPAALGYSGKVFVFNYFLDTGKLVDASAPYSEALMGGRSYYLVVPVGPSGIAMLGDQVKFASLGKKRITQLSDDGSIKVSVSFAAGEQSVTLRGYAPSAPNASATTGSVAGVRYHPATNMFSVEVYPEGGQAAVVLQ